METLKIVRNKRPTKVSTFEELYYKSNSLIDAIECKIKGRSS